MATLVPGPWMRECKVWHDVLIKRNISDDAQAMLNWSRNSDNPGWFKYRSVWPLTSPTGERVEGCMVSFTDPNVALNFKMRFG